MGDLKVIGKAVTREDGGDKVRGRTVYTADVHLAGLLWGKILRSPYPHARIERIDIRKAQQVTGVKAVITGADVKGCLIGKQIRDMPALCWDKVRFIGDRVAAVAAETIDAAEEALSRIDIDYQELPAVFDPLMAMQQDAPRLHEDVAAYGGAPKDLLAPDLPNGLTRLEWRKGDVEQAIDQADLVLEHTFTVPARHQGYLEPHAAIVSIDADDRIQVWVSAKNPFGVRSQMAKALDIPEGRICVNVVNVGGEFGGKGDAIDLPIAYFLAQRSSRPVKLVMDYAEELSAGNPAHPTVITIRSGVKRDGRIIGRSLRAIHTGGAYGGLKANSSLATWHYVGVPYRFENSHFEFLQIYTNTVPGGYYRSPGAVVMAFALESHTDLIAEELAMDPGEFRLKNLLAEGEEDAVGHRLHDVRFRQVLEGALEAAKWRNSKPRVNVGRGISLSARHISGGDTGLVLSAQADGSFTVLSPTIDQGSGTHTILRQLVAEQMNVPVEKVRVLIGNTDTAPRDSGVRASRVTYVAGNAMMKACRELRERLLERAARVLECRVDEIEFRDGRLCLRQDPNQQVTLRRLVSQEKDGLQVAVYEDYPYPDGV
ncbi:MAG TPA: xanthine dehydrogenase family protein, partial [Candidatus Polarisedimenticolaceae bacterium]|nr:xanthine dehydrogenase family protein [Candidatus Polarisedimenticolaceae bacterium]